MRTRAPRTWDFKDTPFNVCKGTKNTRSEQGRSCVQQKWGLPWSVNGTGWS